MDFSYIITPFFAWLVAGCAKFTINTIRAKRFAFNLIGYGGFPSNHSSIVSSAAAIIVFKEGFQEPVLVVALTLAFIVILDANSLRQQVGKHAVALNILNDKNSQPKLRERMGHTRIEILAGILTGVASAWIVNAYFSMLG
jgi:acid phosphatase family membrane protein YuiD